MKKAISLLLLSLLLVPTQVHAQSHFSDVKDDYEYAYSINYLQENGMIQGYDDGTFRPEDTINRVEFLKLVFGAPEGTCIHKKKFSDVEYGSWYDPYLCKALESGYVDGYPDGTFKPADPINFAEAAKILVRANFSIDESASGEWFEPYVKHLSEWNYIPTSIQSFGKKVTRGDVVEMVYRIAEEEDSLPSQKYENLVDLHGDYNVYRGWLVGERILENNGDEGAFHDGLATDPKEDCASLVAGDTGGGDLLSSLIVDQAARKLFNLKDYTSTMLARMEYLVAAKTKQMYGKDFYAFRICKSLDNINVLSGYLWAKGDAVNQWNRPMFLEGNAPSVVAVMFGDNVQLFEIPAIGVTATGGEPPQCEIEPIDGSSMLWTCFRGMDIDHVTDEMIFHFTEYVLHDDGTYEDSSWTTNG